MPPNFAVLIYAGPGVSPQALSQTTHTLRTLLSPYYTVSHLSDQALLSDPWEPSCKLLVMPGGRDLPYVNALSPHGNARITSFVQSGGSYLGICAGAYYASASVVFAKGSSIEVVGRRDLSFWQGACEGPVWEGFEYGSERGARLVSLGEGLNWLYYNGGGSFAPSAQKDGKVLATFVEHGEKPPAAVYAPIGQGHVVLLGFHPEYSLLGDPVQFLLKLLPEESRPTAEAVGQAEERRLGLMRTYLELMDIRLPSPLESPVVAVVENDHPTRPLPQILMAHPTKPSIPHSFLESIRSESSATPDEPSARVLNDANDTFTFYPTTSPTINVRDLFTSTRHLPLSVSEKANMDGVGKAVVLGLGEDVLERCTNEGWCPLWDWPAFWEALDSSREAFAVAGGGEEGRLGDVILYGEVVTSTQTMLDKNPIMLKTLPTPLISIASYQLSGRGRGGNVWLSPKGCLQFSMLVSLPASQSQKVVFVQYLMALAIAKALDPAEGTRDEGRLRVRIKWPNDVYAVGLGPDGKEERLKIGGILVNSHWSGGEFKLIIGCGINILNDLPTTSLASLTDTYNATLSNGERALDRPTMECSFARIISQFESMWSTFLRADKGGFGEFITDYEDRWLHSDQLVHLQSTTPPTAVRIETITLDHGLLRTRPVRTVDYSMEYDRARPLFGRSNVVEQEFIDLQPDGNSFDMLANMIRQK